MRKPHLAGLFASCVLGALTATSVGAQGFPSKPIRFITSVPGGGPDLVARLLAKSLPATLGQQVIIENNGGANGVLAAQAVLRSPPDGHTLLIYSGAFWTLPLLQKTPYDAVQDFAPVSLTASSPSLIVVHPSIPAKSVRELIALAKARPGQLNYASGGTGSANHLAAELFKSMAGVNIVRIAYKGGPDAQNDLVAGRVHLTFASGALIMPMVKAGRLRALAVTSAQPSALFPGMPTADATGLKGYESVSRFSVFAPARTPDPVVHRLSQEIGQALNLPEIKARLFDAGAEVVASTPEQLAEAMKSEMSRLGAVIQKAKITAE